MTAAAATVDGNFADQAPRSRWRRLVLMLVLPVAIATGAGYVWVTGGRFVSTENAYVHQDMVMLSPDVPGRIVEVAVRENDKVTKGQPLFRLDPEPYRLALQAAEASIVAVRLEVEQLRAALQQARAEQVAAQQDLEYRQREFARQSRLAGQGYAAQARLDRVRYDQQTAEQRVAKARESFAGALAALGGDSNIATDQHPRVLEAIARRDQAKLDLEHTVVSAPTNGVISQTDRLQVGQYIPTGTPVLSLVESDDRLVEANFKETDLTYMRPGQPATVELDAFPGKVFTARVDSIGAGTGSEFSLLPAQNATGNWVKVVQRVPVRVRLEEELPDVSLRAGLSADVEVDTGHVRALPSPIRTALSLTGLTQAEAAQ
jgi:membrane fusion protein (multidrug efflux system)